MIKKFDKESIEYVYDEIDKLHIANFESKYNNDFDKGVDHAYRKCLRICTNILNNPLRLKKE